MKEKEMVVIGKLIAKVVQNIGNEAVTKQAAKEVKALCEAFPLYKGVIF